MERPKARARYYLPNRRKYLGARKAGWMPLQGTALEPWERRLAAKSLRTVLEHGVGSERKIDATNKAMRKIAPIAAKELKGVIKGKIPEKDWHAFCRLMDWYAEKLPEYGRPLPEEIRRLGKEIDERANTTIRGAIAKSASDPFEIRQEGRYYHRQSPDFKADIEFQLKHDINYTLSTIRRFLGKATE